MDSAVTVAKKVSTPGAGTAGFILGIAAMEATKIHIYITQQLGVTIWGEPYATINCTAEIAYDHVDGASLTLLGGRVVLTHLVHGKHIVQMSVHGQIKQHAIHGRILLLLPEGCSIQVRSMANLGCLGCIWVAFFHPSHFQDFLIIPSWVMVMVFMV